MILAVCFSSLNLIFLPRFLRFDNEKNRKSHKRYIHFYPGSVSLLLYSLFILKKTNI